MVVPALELVVLIFEVRQTVSWAPDDPEQLGERENEVEDLRNEEEQHCLAKVPKNANNCKGHPSEVAVRVTNEYFGGKRVVLHQRERCHQEWYDYRHRELVLIVNDRAFLVELHLLFAPKEKQSVSFRSKQS